MCHKSFNRLDNKNCHEKTCSERHVITDHNGQKYHCSTCHKSFNRLDNRKRHEKTCTYTGHVCPTCNKRYSTADGLRRHLQCHGKEPAPSKQSTVTRPPQSLNSITTCHSSVASSEPSTRSSFRCRRCTRSFENRHDLYLHGMQEHYQVGGALQPRPWNNANAPWIQEGEDQQLREEYEANTPLILEPHNLGPVRSVYNFPIDNDITLVQLIGFADNIYNREQRAFHLNIVFGVILQHRETGQYRYFVPYNNNGIFECPFYVSKRADLNRLRLRLRRLEIVEELLRHRPDTKWMPVLMTNVHYIIFNTNYPIGQGQLPDYLL